VLGRRRAVRLLFVYQRMGAGQAEIDLLCLFELQPAKITAPSSINWRHLYADRRRKKHGGAWQRRLFLVNRYGSGRSGVA